MATSAANPYTPSAGPSRASDATQPWPRRGRPPAVRVKKIVGIARFVLQRRKRILIEPLGEGLRYGNELRQVGAYFEDVRDITLLDEMIRKQAPFEAARFNERYGLAMAELIRHVVSNPRHCHGRKFDGCIAPIYCRKREHCQSKAHVQEIISRAQRSIPPAGSLCFTRSAVCRRFL
jgi:hypothetical protein